MSAGLTRHTQPNRARLAMQMREGGATWSEIAQAFGYANQRSARASVICVARDDEHRQRLRDAAPAKRSAQPLDNGNGYTRIRIDHQVAGKTGWAYEHRVVLYDKIGSGVHPCHHCATDVEWGTTLEVDHLDFDRTNNTAANLVPSCRACNTRRQVRQPPPFNPLCHRGHMVRITAGGWRYCPTCRRADANARVTHDPVF